ncbi:MAG: hypothetical protein QM674_11875 [Burkholderiaceae bacterium]
MIFSSGISKIVATTCQNLWHASKRSPAPPGLAGTRRDERVRSDRTQRRLREMVEIPDKVEPRFGSALTARAWHRSGRRSESRSAPDFYGRLWPPARHRAPHTASIGDSR